LSETENAVRVGSLAAVERGEPTLATLPDGRDVALFLCHGKVVATQGQCPHAQGPISEGWVEEGVLTCPWHGWTFDLDTGACLEDDSVVIHRFQVRIDGDDVSVIS
jgi:nitrite reductase/ring-hydroxylating ferredoxin subunit